jgi:hypothetical protein
MNYNRAKCIFSLLFIYMLDFNNVEFVRCENNNTIKD